jgi:hypothetical protein
MTGVTVARRSLLAAGASGTGGLAGCLDGADDPESTAPERRSTPPDAVGTAAGLEPSKSGRIGDTVYYDPANPGPYDDGQDALSDVEAGGVFRIAAGTYDVAAEGGPIAVDRPVTIRGSGWSRVYDGEERRFVGTQIVNHDVEAPTIEFDGSDGSVQGVRIRDLRVGHTIETEPAVRFIDTFNTLVADTWIGCGSKAPTGITYEGRSFFARVTRSHVSSFTDVGIHVTANAGSYSHEFYSTWSSSARPGATCLQTEVHGTIVVGGEFAATGEDGTALRFFCPDERGRTGGVVLEPGIEHTHNPIVIDGAQAPFDGVQIHHTTLRQLHHDAANAGVYFGNARNCKVLYPVVPGYGQEVELFHWSEDADHCGVVSDAGSLAWANATYTDDGARAPYVSVTGTTDDVSRRRLPTGVPTTVEYDADVGGPILHDGGEWRRTATESL